MCLSCGQADNAFTATPGKKCGECEAVIFRVFEQWQGPTTREEEHLTIDWLAAFAFVILGILLSFSGAMGIAGWALEGC